MIIYGHKHVLIGNPYSISNNLIKKNLISLFGLLHNQLGQFCSNYWLTLKYIKNVLFM